MFPGFPCKEASDYSARCKRDNIAPGTVFRSADPVDGTADGLAEFNISQIFFGTIDIEVMSHYGFL